MYQRAGIMLLNICNNSGMFSMGNINPDRIIVGSINAIIDINIATIWLFAMVEIKIPRHNAISIKRMVSSISKIKLPVMGTPKINRPTRTITKAFAMESKR